MKRHYVYAMICEAVGGMRFVKFGYSSNVYSRAASMQTGCPLYIEQALSFEVTAGELTARYVESVLHTACAERHSAGEWFRFSDSDDVVEDIRGVMHSSISAEAFSHAVFRTIKFKPPEPRRSFAKKAHVHNRMATGPVASGDCGEEIVIGNVTKLPEVRIRRSRVSSFKNSFNRSGSL